MTIERSSGGGDLRLTLKLLWGKPERPNRGPKPALSLDQIVEAAVKIADTDGLGALSMRRVATALDVGTMSLYRYVPGKAELLDLMLDRVCDPGDTAERVEALDWREMLEVVARGTWSLYLAHPWLLQVNWARPVLGPNSLAGVEIVQRGLLGTGLSDQERVMVMFVLDGFVTGAARGYLNARRAGETGVLSDDEYWAAQGPALEQALLSGDYPTLAAMSEDSFAFGQEQAFEFGLNRLLDGIDSFITNRRTAGHQ
ncbi:MAG TPA: TetR/AcrR family transcriptional regulator [Actinomycetes bacterium]|nr:TetR/AcrR family transcriptional regulator [Actinomycetes bacterium]